jgi:hypothetical protein
MKRDYHVAEAHAYFLLFSPKGDRDGNFAVIPKKGVEYVARQLGGQHSVTCKEAFDACRRSKFITDRFAVLHALYVLIVTKRARISKIVNQTQYFSVRKQSG